MANGIMEDKLSSGRKVLIKDMSIDAIDACKDSMRISFSAGVASSVSGVNASRTLWIRKGLAGGDFKTKWNKNTIVPDKALKELKPEEYQELSEKIQEAQR